MNTVKKTFNRLLAPAYIAASLLAATGGIVQADDTDIYVNNTPAPPSVPMVMFSIDYRPNLGSTVCSNISSGCAAAEYFRQFPETAAWMDAIVPAGAKFEYFDMLRLALHVVLSDITGVKVGLMMNHDNANNCAGPNNTGCSNGAYIVKGFNQLVEGDTNGALEGFTQSLFALDLPQGNLSHSFQGKELYFEFFRYLTGQGIYNAHNGWTDYASNSSSNLDVDDPLAAWDTAIEQPSTKKYISPLVGTDACARIFAINFYGGQVNQEDDSDSAIAASKSSGGLGVAMNDFVDIVAYMHDADLADDTYGDVPTIAGEQGVTSYFITSNPNRDEHELAFEGGTNKALTLTDDPEALVNALTSVFKEILSVSTTFVAASVPVNVFNRSESLDNVFIALFQAENEPFWNGNLKKLKLKVVESALDQSKLVELQDALGNTAIALDGRIKHDALTYWTDGTSLPDPTPDTEEEAGRDGRVVNRGAAGQMIPGFINQTIGTANDIGGGEPGADGPRKVLYDNGEGQPLAALDATTETATALKGYFGTDDAGALDAITWLRGINPVTGETRRWLLGDPLHSRPLPINYGLRDGHDDQSNPLIYIAMASNDGYMHFIRNTNGDGDELGREVWAFVPTDIMGTIPSLVQNAPMVPKHPYTVDGAPAAFLDDVNGDGSITGTEEAYLYFGLRRGGRVYYALDVSDPDAPELAWTIKKGDTGFETLGQTWSRPQVGMMDYDADGTKDPVVVFGGGYDPGKDARGSAVGTDDDEGNAIYVVHAKTGELIYKATHASMLDSIPSDVTIVDTNGDQLIDRIIAGDTGGNVWRVDTYGDLDNWQTTLLAKLGRHYVSDTANDRRFFHRPDFVQAQTYVDVETTVDGVTTVSQELVQFDAVLIGSGNRPNPLDQEYVNPPVNWLYMIRDDRLKPAKASPSPAYAVDDLAITHGTLGDITDPATGTPTTDGWRLLLDVGDGEKSLSSPLTLSNTVFFTTYLPTGTDADQDPLESTTCGPSEGSGLLYAVDLATGLPKLNYNSSDDTGGENTTAEDRYKELDSGGIPADVVGINLDGQAYVLPPDLTPEKVDAATRWRTFWYEVEDSDL